MNTDRKRVLFYLPNILVPILAGGLIYLRLRPDTYVGAFLGGVLHLPGTAGAGEPSAASVFVRGYAPDMLWAYALAFSVCAVLGGGRRGRLTALGLCVPFAAAVELLQLTGLFRGTFDMLDILFEAISVFAALFIIKKYEEEENEKSSKSSKSDPCTRAIRADGARQRERRLVGALGRERGER